jgi:hypothetical protein
MKTTHPAPPAPAVLAVVMQHVEDAAVLRSQRSVLAPEVWGQVLRFACTTAGIWRWDLGSGLAF